MVQQSESNFFHRFTFNRKEAPAIIFDLAVRGIAVRM
jgi:hypothetical protein